MGGIRAFRREFRSRVYSRVERLGITSGLIWEFPKIRGTFLGVPILRIIVYWGLYWGTLILGKYHLGHSGIGKKAHVSGVLRTCGRSFFDSAVKHFNVWKLEQGKLVPPAILRMLRFAGYVVCKLAQDFFDPHS